jgi:hypothetical protein
MKNPQQRKQLEDMADVWDRLARERRISTSGSFAMLAA